MALAATGARQIPAPVCAFAVVIRGNGERRSTAAGNEKHLGSGGMSFGFGGRRHTFLATGKSSTTVRKPRESECAGGVHHASANNGQQGLGLADLVRIDFKNVLRDDNEVGQLAGFYRTLVLLTVSGERRI